MVPRLVYRPHWSSGLDARLRGAPTSFGRTKRNTNFVAAIAAIIFGGSGGIASVTHLSHPENMLAALNHPTSGIFTEALLVGLTALFALVYLVMLKREMGAGARRLFAVLAAVAGIVLAFAAGASYMMPAPVALEHAACPLAYGGTAMRSAWLSTSSSFLAKHEDNIRDFQMLPRRMPQPPSRACSTAWQRA